MHCLIVEGGARLASLVTVLIDTSTTREIDRMEEPSTSMGRIWTSLAIGSLFMKSRKEFHV